MGGRIAGALEIAAEQATGRGSSGVVAAAAPLAAALGAEALRAGGNAHDAVVVAALAETVLLPPKCGLAGDLVAVRVRAGQAPEALLAIGGAPAGLAEAARAGRLEATGPTSVGVPGAPAGYAALASGATRPLSDLVAPAVALARDGFVWSQICTVLTEESLPLLRQHTPHPTSYLPEGRPLAPGDVVRLPGIAEVLETFGTEGARLFHGPLGAELARFVRTRGGVLTAEDLTTAAAEWLAPVRVQIGAGTLWATPAPTHGPSLLAALADAEPSHAPADSWRRVQQAIRARRATLADPGAAAATSASIGEGTSIVSAVDREGTAIVVIHSNSYPRYGSGLVLPGYELILANRAGRGFSTDPDHPNFPAAGRRPATTLHAWCLTQDDGGLLGGTPGGANQMPWNVQLLTEVIAGESRPGHLVTRPRWEWVPEDDGIRIEDGFDDAELRGLAEVVAGPVVHVPRWGLRSAQQVVALPRPGRVEARVAAVDPRTGGAAVPV